MNTPILDGITKNAGGIWTKAMQHIRESGLTGQRLANLISTNTAGTLGSLVDTSLGMGSAGKPLINLFRRAQRGAGGWQGYLSRMAKSPNAGEVPWLRTVFGNIEKGQTARMLY